MNLQEYITQKEYEKCKQIKYIFDKLMENKSGFNEFCIADAYPFGFVVLEWFYKNAGFDTQTYFQNASDLFDYLMKVWEFGYIYCLKDKYGDCEMSDKELKKMLSIEDSEAMEAICHDLIMQYENIALMDYIDEYEVIRDSYI